MVKSTLGHPSETPISASRLYITVTNGSFRYDTRFTSYLIFCFVSFVRPYGTTTDDMHVNEKTLDSRSKSTLKYVRSVKVDGGDGRKQPRPPVAPKGIPQLGDYDTRAGYRASPIDQILHLFLL